MNLPVKKIHPDAVIPKYANKGDSGFDLVAVEDVIIQPGETKLVKTGLAFEIPEGYEIQVRPRSGITLKTKLRVQLGTIDSNYRGEVGVIVDNANEKPEYKEWPWIKTIDGESERTKYLGKKRDPYFGTQDSYEGVFHGTYLIRKGDRIAQAILAPVVYTNCVEVDKLEETERGSNGYGSTGVRR